MTLVVNLYGGPGTGKSTTATGAFSLLKLMGINVEYASEFIKDAVWEQHHQKYFAAQEFIVANQYKRIRNLDGMVDVIITDSPIMLGLIYISDDYPFPALKDLILQMQFNHSTLDIVLTRTKEYQQAGRYQTEDEAKEIDKKIYTMLHEHNIPHTTVVSDKYASSVVAYLVEEELKKLKGK